MLEKKYNELKNITVKKAFYISGTSALAVGLILVFTLAVSIIPLAVVIGIIGVLNWMYASHYFHQKFMFKQHEVIELSFKENLPSFSLDIGGIPKTDLLDKLGIPYIEATYLPSFVVKGKIKNVEVCAYSVSYKLGIEKDFTYGRVYSFRFEKKPYALNLKEFDSPIVLCSTNTEQKYTDRDTILHFASPSRQKNNIYSLFLNKYASITEYCERIQMELKFLEEIINVSLD